MGHIKNVRIFDSRTSGSCEINKKQSGNSFAGHPVFGQSRHRQPVVFPPDSAKLLVLIALVSGQKTFSPHIEIACHNS